MQEATIIKPEKSCRQENRLSRSRYRITKIEASKPEPAKLKVAAYCRVSTGYESQKSSLENQRMHYQDLILKRHDWEFADIYYDEGLSGTKKELRPELNRMIADCKKGKIDLILTKSISRFARNTTDCLEMVRTLTETGAEILFEKEKIHTGSVENEFLLTLLASLAEEESHSISGNEKWAIRKRFQNGTYKYSKAPYGYRLSEGSFIVNETEAGVVREIFSSAISGKGSCVIAAKLNNDGIPAGTKKRDGSPARWTSSKVLGILKNVVYTGDVLMQKTFHDGQFRRFFNYGEEPQYYYEGHHEAIISKEVFDLAQAAVRQRGKEKGNIPEEDKRKRNNPHQNRYCFSGKIFCGSCGSMMKRQVMKQAHGTVIRWCCRGHLESCSLCGQKNILEENLKNAFMTMLNKLSFAEELILGSYMEELRFYEKQKNMRLEEEFRKQLHENSIQRNRLVILAEKGCINRDIHKKEIELELEAVRIRNDISELKQAGSLSDETQAFRTFICEWGDRIDNGKAYQFPEEAFGIFVEKAVVYARRRFEFHLKCGLVLSEDIYEEA